MSLCRVLAVAILVLVGMASSTQAETSVLQTPISGDLVAVTLEISPAPGGDGVDFDLSLPPGTGDLLGLFGNLVDESLVPALGVEDPTGIVTQWQFSTNSVFKVGGGNTMAPVKMWDWGIRIGNNGSAGGAVESATFGLRAPGLTVAGVLGAINQGWVLGVRIQSTSGASGSSKMGLADGEPPVTSGPPTITIDQPLEGTITNQSPVAVVGTVTGEGAAVEVDGQAVAVVAGAYGVDVALVEGANSIVATATNGGGSASAVVTVVLDTVAPVVAISAPTDGTFTSAGTVLVEGTVSDANPIASLLVDGQPVPIVGGNFQISLTLPLDQTSTISAIAIDAAGNEGGDSISVTQGAPPSIAIDAPLDGATISATSAVVSGTVSGSAPISVVVNGVVANLGAGVFDAVVPLVEGANSISAEISNPFGVGEDSIAVVRDTTAPSVTVASPPDGTRTSAVVVDVRVDVSDATALSSVLIGGAIATLDGGQWVASISLAPGPNAILIEATDAAGNLADTTLTVVRVSAPSLTSTPATSSVDEREIFFYDVDAIDPDVGDLLTFTLEAAPSTATIDDTTGEIVWLTSAADLGTTGFVVRVTDLDGLFDQQSFYVTVLDVNETPTFLSSPVLEVNERDPYLYVVSVEDPDQGDMLTLSLEDGPAGLALDAGAGTLSWTPGAGDLGANAVRIRVTDAGGLFAEQSYTLTVFDVNDAPSITSTPTLEIDERAAYGYAVGATDPDAGDTLVFSLAEGPAGMGIDAASGLVSWTPAENDLGSHPVRVRATDAGGLFDEQAFSLTVLNVPDAPTITSTPILAVNERDGYLYAVLANDPDPGETLTLSLEGGPAGMSVDAPTGEIRWLPGASEIGSHPVTIRVTDSTGLFDEQSFVVIVVDVPEAPEITSLPITTIDEHAGYVYPVLASDPDAGELLTLSLVSGPVGMLADVALGSIVWLPGAADLGDHEITIRVTDSTGLFDEQTYTLTILAVNEAPSFTSTPPTDPVEEGDTFVYQASAIDPDAGDTFGFTLVSGPSGFEIDLATGASTWTTTTNDRGTHAVTIRVTDLGGLFEDQSFTVEVLAPSLPPQIASTPRTVTTIDVAYAYLVLAIDPNPGDVLTYSLDTAPAGMTIGAATGVVEWTPSTPEIGSHPISVRVADQTGLATTQDYVLVVAVPPVADFTVRKNINWANRNEGASVANVSSIVNSSFGANNAIDPDLGGSWLGLTSTNEHLTVDLQGDAPVVVDEIVIQPHDATSSPQHYEVRVSETTDDPSQMTTLLADRMPPGGSEYRVTLPDGTTARFVSIVILDNYGGTRIGIRNLEMLSRRRTGGVVSLLEGGAEIVDASSGLSTAGRAIDFPTLDTSFETAWVASACNGESFTIDLQGDRNYLVDEMSFFHGNSSAIATNVTLRASTTGLAPEDFTDILTTQIPIVAGTATYRFDRTEARYVQFVVNTCGNANFGARVFDLQLTSPQLGGLDVAFDDLSSAVVGEIVSWDWSFGDGVSSSDANPRHHYNAAGTYPVTLTVTDSNGLRTSVQMDYVAEAPPEVDFSVAPAPREAISSTYTDLSIPAPGGVVSGREWRFGAANPVRTTSATRVQTFSDNGIYPVSLRVFDGQLHVTELVQDIEVANRPPTATVNVDEAIFWGEHWSIMKISGGDPGSIIFGDVTDDRALYCSIDYGDGTPLVEPANGGQCTGNFFDAEAHSYAAPGNYEVTFTFRDKDGAEITRKALVTARKRETGIVLHGETDVDASGIAMVKATLLDRVDPGLRMSGQIVEFDFAGSTVSAGTDADGMAMVPLAFVSGAENVVTVRYAGDANYTATRETTAYRPGTFPGIVRTGPPPAPNTRGSEFMTSFWPNNDARAYVGTAALFVAAEQHTFARIEAPGVGFDELIEVFPGQVSQIAVPGELRGDFHGTGATGERGRIEQKGIRVSAAHELSLYGLNFQSFTTDGYLAYPNDALGTEHIVVSYENVFAGNSGLPGYYGIVAPEDGTTVTVTPSVRIPTSANFPEQPAGVPFSFTLDAFERIFFSGFHLEGESDPSGTIISSDKPVAVSMFMPCASVPTGSSYCDHVVEQLPSVDKWGDSFLLAPFEGRSIGYLLRVVAATDGTDILLDGVSQGVLDRGDYLELDLPQTAYASLESTHPILAIQINKSGTLDATRRDPFVSLVVPTAQFGNDYLMSAVPADVRDFADRLTIIAPTAEVGGIRVDGNPVASTWVPIGTTDYSAAFVTVSSNNHRIQHVNATLPFGVYGYGWALDESYAFVGEMRMLDQTQPCTLSTSIPGDGIDNDCDGRVDEERGDGLDEDGDDSVDEDLVFEGGPAVNLPPIAYESASSVREEASRVVILVGFDPNGDALSYEIVDPPSHGTLTGTGNQRTYTPNPDYTGPDFFTYRVDDGVLDSETVVFALEVFPLNDAPDFTSTPITTATEGVLYLYSVLVLDRDGDVGLTYSLPTAPTGMTIDAIGIVEWIPGDDQTGSNSVTIRVTDPSGASRDQSFTIDVANVNDAPAIISTPRTTPLVAGTPFFYNPSVYDPDPGDTLAFFLDAGPPGMTIDGATGAVAWTPTPADLGTSSATIRVVDAAGESDSQSWTLAVIEDENPPVVTVTANPIFLLPGQSTTIRVSATDEVAIAQINLTVNGVLQTLDANGEVVFTPGGPGVYTAQGSAIDAAGNTAVKELIFAVGDPTDTTPPFVELIAPVDDEVFTSPTDIIGTVQDPNLAYWTVEIGRVDDGDEGLRTILEGTTAQDNAILGEFDPTLLENGMWRIVLTGFDVNGSATQHEAIVRVEGALKVGVFSLSFVDMEVPLAGLPISVVRTYDSRIKTQEDFGVGWTLSIARGTAQSNRSIGQGWQITTDTTPFSFPCTNVIEQLNHTTEVRLSDTEYFVFRPVIANTFPFSGGCRADVFFQQTGGSRPGAELDIVGNTGVRAAGEFTPGPGDFLSEGALYDEFTQQPFDPKSFRLRTPEGREFDVSTTGGVSRIEDTNGNQLFITDNGIFHSTGTAVSFERDAQGRIERLVDPLGQTVEYSYDANGDLVGVTNQVSATTEFEYSTQIPHHLTAIIDPMGRRTATAEYDSNGRLIALENGLGEGTTFQHDLAANREITFDALGRPTTHVYDDRGNVLQIIDALGESQFFSYDADDHVLTQTDQVGHTRTMEYDAGGNLVRAIDPATNEALFSYDGSNRLLTMTDPRGAQTTHEYDAKGNLTRSIDDAGNEVRATYDSRGLMRTLTDRRGEVTTFEYDSSGRVTRRIDAEGVAVEFSYDALGRMLSETSTRTDAALGVVSETVTHVYDGLGREIETIDAEGNSSRVEFNLLGQRAATIDADGVRMEFEYDLAGRLSRTLYADGTEETFDYDAAGRRMEEVGRAGDLTTFEYDELGRLTRTIFDDGTFTRNEYDPRGLLTASIDERGHRSENEYNELGQLELSRNALLEETHFEYDANGNRTRIEDALGHETVFSYDELNRRIRTTFDDGSFEESTYDDEGQLTLQSDPNGEPTSFEYDGVGRLTKVVDALGGETVYGYDESGNRIAQTDANLHTTRWAYDTLGRPVRHELPMGMFRTYAYDAVGNQIEQTDFEGNPTELLYDDLGRLIERRVPGETAVTFSYTPDGLRETATDQRGTTTYTYDGRRRLTRVDHPGGEFVAYAYDDAGNRTSVVSPAGATSYTYDPLNRLETVTDSDGGTTTYTYDAAGNRAGAALPNGTIASWTHDPLNRLTNVEHRRSDLTVFSRYQYSLDNAGNRLTVQDQTGRLTTYTYDALHRLTREESVGGLLANRTIDHAYDAVGNRTLETVDGVPVSATYDANDRIETQGSVTYSYDDDGNTLEKSGPSGTTTYTYDELNRLTGINGPTTTSSYAYDADSQRIEATENGTTTRYLIDANRRFAQVVEERDAANVIQAHLSWGMGLISQTRSGTRSYFHPDGHGSVRALTDASQAVTDTYDYDAYGGLLDRTGTTTNAYRYAGEQFVEGLDGYYLRARYYEPGKGRFLTRDEFAGFDRNPLTLNGYLYGDASPVVQIDPSGRFSLAQTMTTVGAITSLALSATSVYSGIINISEGNVVRGSAEVALGFMGAGAIGGGIRVLQFARGPVNIAIRAGYARKLVEIGNLVPELIAAGRTSEQIAKALVATRNAVKLSARARMIEEGGWAGRILVKGLEVANRLRYGNPLGPSAEWLLRSKGSWEKVIEGAKRANEAVNRFTGVI